MPNATVEIDTNLEDAEATLRSLNSKVPESADDAAKIIAHSWIREAQRVMQRNGSVVTGTGIRSFRTVNHGEGETSVMGADYLMDLDTGTMPHWPDTNNYRFVQAAKSYGMTRQELAETIARKGTRPHPWIKESTARIRRSAPKRLKIQFRKAVSDSMMKSLN